MGILIESKTVNREKRYMGLNINKNRMGVNSGTITVATGYYDTFIEGGSREWVTEKEEVIYLSNDQLTALFVIKPSHVGLTAAQTNLFALLDKAIYAVLEGLIPITYSLTVVAKAKKDNSLLHDYSVSVTKADGTHIFSSYAMNNEPVLIKGDIALGAIVTINKYGHKPYVKEYPMLSGDVTLDVLLEEEVAPTPPQPDPEPTPPVPEE